jgi:hypothetical protein
LRELKGIIVWHKFVVNCQLGTDIYKQCIMFDEIVVSLVLLLFVNWAYISLNTLDIHVQNFRFVCWNLDCIGILSICLCSITMVIIKSWGHIYKCRHESFYIQVRRITRNYRWFAHLHIQNGVSKRIWILTYSWTGNFLLAWAGQFSGIKNHTMHRFDQYLKYYSCTMKTQGSHPVSNFEA